MNETVILLYGGLGNQLFQYAFGEYLRHRYSMNVSYDLSSFGVLPTYRSYQLSILVDKLPQYKTSKLFFSRFSYIKRRLLCTVFRLSPKVKYYNELRDKIEESNLCKYNEKLLYLEGYWQNFKYIKWLHQNVSKDLLAPILMMPKIIKEDYNYIVSNDCISVHIRRGDYLQKNNAAIMARCSLSYFINGTKKILESNPAAHIVVFSDDLEWVKDNFKSEAPVHYIESRSINPYWDVYLMSLCHHNVISNSTFSWWGAYLNKYTDKIVIAPKRWFNKSDNPNLYLENWTIIEN